MDKRSVLPVGTALLDAGYRVALVDLRGHGESTGDYLTYGLVDARDVSAVLDSLAVHAPLGATGAYGFSYGAAVALELAASDGRIASVVAVAPFSSLRRVVNDYEQRYLPAPLKLIPDAWFQDAVDRAGRRAGFDPDGRSPAAAIARSHGPVLLIHGESDTQVPPYHSRTLASAGGARTRLVTVPNESHASIPTDLSGTVRRETVAWFDGVIANRAPPAPR
jgi:dipeptidyl aminopeptidase/acylaminoacyl peptidase